MITGLASYKVLFMIQLVIGEGMFLFRLERRQSFLRGACVALPALLLIAWRFPILGYNAWYLSALFLTFFLLTLAAGKLLFDEPLENILLCCIAGYTVQHLSYLLYTTFIDATQIGRVFGNVIDPYGSGPVAVNDLWMLQVVFYIDIYFLVYTGAFEFFDQRLRRNHSLRLGRPGMICLSGLLIAADVITNMITTYYTTENLVSLLLERSYNILLCVLILALLYNQLSQRELKDELAGVQYILDQGKRQYELAKKANDLVSMKYHDLRHQSELLRRRGAQAEEERRELDQVLASYDVLVRTDNEVLDVLLTEKTMLCRDRKIQLLCMADGRGLEFVKAHHLYALLGNAIDNAMEAVQALPEEERVISLHLRRQGSLVHIHVENPCLGTVTLRDGLPVTTKGDHGFHGYGMLSMKTLAEQYGGGLTVSVEQGVFVLDVVLSADSQDAGAE